MCQLLGVGEYHMLLNIDLKVESEKLQDDKLGKVKLPRERSVMIS